MKSKRLLTALACVTMLVGCAVVPLDDPYYGAPVVRVEPPPPQYEFIGAPPMVGHIWIGGYWNWMGARYVWIPGHWDAPRPGYHWAPHRWEPHDGNHWRSYGGRWERGEAPRVIVPTPSPSHDKHRPPPSPHTERRDPPHVAPPPPRVEREKRRPMEIDPHPSMERRTEPPPPRVEHQNRNDRRGRDLNRDADVRSDSR